MNALAAGALARPCSALDLVVDLLREAAHSSPPAGSAAAFYHEVSRVGTSVEQLLRNERAGLDLSSSVRQSLAELLSGYAGVDPVAVNRGLALGVDSALGHHFWRPLIGLRRLRPGDPIPSSRDDPSAWVGPATVNPATLERDRLDRTPHLVLAPPQVDEVDVDLEILEPAENVARRGVRFVVVVQTNASMTEFEWDEDSGRGCFFLVRPSSTDAAANSDDDLVTLAEAALQQAADVVVLPELAVSRAAAERIGTLAKSLDYPPAVLVAGSHHFDDSGHKSNRAVVWFSGDPSSKHVVKNTPYALRRRGQPTLTEDLTLEPRPRLYVRGFGNWSAATVICLDLIEPLLNRLIADLRVNLVCVPAMTPELDPFETAARELATRNQAVTVVGNTPADRGGHAVIGFPRRNDLARRYLPGQHGLGAGKGVVAISLATGIPRWTQLP